MNRIAALAILLTLTTPFWELGHPLWEVDDARYAEVPREMHEGGDWLTPRLNYVDYIEKPPLIYWLGAASYSVFGVGEAAARLPLALVALLGLLGVWWLGDWLYGEGAGAAAALILGTCAEFYSLSHVITPDMTVSVALLWATGLILRCLRRPEDGRWAGALAWVAMAAAFLSKGLIGLLLPALWTCALLVLFPALRRGLRPLLLNWGLPFFAAVIGGWFIAMERSNPGFFNVFVIEQHFQRFLTPKYNRPGPWYYFIGVELVGGLPWTPLLIAAVAAPLARWRRADARDKQLCLWILIVLGFFSVSSSKLVTYILPLFAHQALLGARLLSRLGRDRALALSVFRGAAGLGGVFLVAGLAAPVLASRIDAGFVLSRELVLTGTALLAVLAAAQFTLARAARRSPAGALIATTAWGLCACALLAVGGRCATEQLSVKRMSQALNARIAALGPFARPRLLAYNIYLHGIPYYTGRPVDVINWTGELHYAKRFARFAHRFGDDDTIRALPDPAERTYVTLRRRDLDRFLALNPAVRPDGLTQFGPWMLAEY